MLVTVLQNLALSELLFIAFCHATLWHVASAILKLDSINWILKYSVKQINESISSPNTLFIDSHSYTLVT